MMLTNNWWLLAPVFVPAVLLLVLDAIAPIWGRFIGRSRRRCC